MLHGLPVACRGEGGSFFEKTCVLERFVLWRHLRRDWRRNEGYVAISHHHMPAVIKAHGSSMRP